MDDHNGIIEQKVMIMLTEERHEYIIDKLKKENTVKIKDLQTELDCSISTVRRDLSDLEEQGLLVRVHGGAKRIYTLSSEMEMEEKSTKNIQEKKEIGELAASFVKNEDIIYLDAGTTTYEMIPFLKDKEDLLVVTNGVNHANLLLENDVSTILLGGQIKKRTKAIIGSVALSQLKQYRFAKTFLGMNGIDTEFGYTTPDTEEASLKRVAGSLSNQTYVLTDQSKFHKINFVKVNELEDFAIITNQLNEADRELFTSWTKIWEANK